MRSLDGTPGAVLPRLRALDRQTQLNQQAQIPLFWGIGLIAPALIFPSLFLYLTGRMTRGSLACRLALPGVHLLAAWPLALLLAPLFYPFALGPYLSMIALLTALIALLPSPALIFSLTAIVLLGDGLAGTPLVSQSVLSSYALAGIRFYGIGNEYMGLLIGGALLAVATTRLTSGTPPELASQLTSPCRGGMRKRKTGRLFLLPHPGTGRVAEGRGREGFSPWEASSSGSSSSPSFCRARRSGRRRGGRSRRRRSLHWPVCGCAASGCAGGTSWSGLLLALPWCSSGRCSGICCTCGGRTWIARSARWKGGVSGIFLAYPCGKVGLAVRVFLHGGTLLGILALALLALAARTVLWPHLAAYYAGRPRLAAVSRGGSVGRPYLCSVQRLRHRRGDPAADVSDPARPARAVPTLMRLLALDIGDVRIGVAVCDSLEIAAYPLATVTRVGSLKRDVATIAVLVAEQEADAVVVGLPLSLDGDVGPQAQKVQGFTQALSKIAAVPFVFWDESLSSVEAEERLIAQGVSPCASARPD